MTFTLIATGTTQADAAPLVGQHNVIIGGDPGMGVLAIVLPKVKCFTVWNRSGSDKLIWPPTGVQFEGMGVNAPISIPDNSKFSILLTSPTQGYVG